MFTAAKGLFSSVTSVASTTFQGIKSIFQSKPEIKSDTLIMGIPAWTVLVGVGVYVYWNKRCHDKRDERDACVEKQIQDLILRVSEIERDDKESLRRENAELRQQLLLLQN
jgi:hypothetical protein